MSENFGSSQHKQGFAGGVLIWSIRPPAVTQRYTVVPQADLRTVMDADSYP